MFWKKNSKAKKTAPKKELTPEQRSAQIKAEALENVRAARAHIGEDTLDKIAASVAKKQQTDSALEQAKARIEQQNATRVAEEILDMLETKH